MCFTDMEKIAVYGGSFDPPHIGHKTLSLNLAKACGADKIIIVPTALSPFKESSGASAQDRLQMCKIFFKEDIFEVSDIEINRGGKSYTVDTLRSIKEKYPDSQLFLFMGDDMLLSFDRWYNYKEILELSKIVCACRNVTLDKLSLMKDYVKSVLKTDVIICEDVPVEVSSTEIRGDITGKGKEFLHGDVYEYIIQRGLYI